MNIPMWLMDVLSKAKIQGAFCDPNCPFLTPAEGLCNMEKNLAKEPTVLEVLESNKDYKIVGDFRRCDLCLEVEKVSRGA